MTMESKVYPAERAQQVWLSSDVYTILADGEATGQALSLTDGWVPPGGGPPSHIHAVAMEIIYVAAGEITVSIDGQDHVARAGDTAVITPGTAHCFKNTATTPARVMFIFAPAGTEQFFVEAGSAPIPGVPVPVASEADNAEAARIGLKYGLVPPSETAAEPGQAG
jgi:quercetin dioxygenase-like cupin family protein